MDETPDVILVETDAGLVEMLRYGLGMLGLSVVHFADEPTALAALRVLGRRRMYRDGVTQRLTPIGWKLLRVLVDDAGSTISHQQIFDAVWERPYGHAQGYLRVFLTKLRQKIEPNPATPRLILTERKVGYRFQLPA